MRIAYFLDIAEGLGGAGNTLLEQAKIMSEIHDVVVVIPCTEQGVINKEYEKRCNLANMQYVGMYYKSAYEFQGIDICCVWNTVKSIYNFIFLQKFDLIHSVQMNIVVELVSRYLQIPHVMNVYSLRKEEFSLKYCDIYPQYHSCDSEVFCDLWREGFAVESKCIRTSAPLNKRITRKYQEKKKYEVLMLGYLCDYKNQLSAIKVIYECNKRGIKINLTLAGTDNSKYAELCRVYVEENNLKDNIHIIGFQSEVGKLLEKADLFLCTSKRESFPSSIVEAITYGLPIVSTPVAGVPELLVDKENAYIAKSFDDIDILNSVLDCINGFKNRSIEEIQENAGKTWDEYFAPQKVREQLNDYYMKIVHEKKGKVFEEAVWKRLYDKTMGIYWCLEKNGHKNDVVSERCFYYAYLQDTLKKGTAYIWGAGKMGRFAEDAIRITLPQVEIKAFIDSAKKGIYCGLPIISPEDIDKNIDYIFVSFIYGQTDVIESLEKQGWEYNKNLWRCW